MCGESGAKVEMFDDDGGALGTLTPISLRLKNSFSDVFYNATSPVRMVKTTHSWGG